MLRVTVAKGREASVLNPPASDVVLPYPTHSEAGDETSALM